MVCVESHPRRRKLVLAGLWSIWENEVNGIAESFPLLSRSDRDANHLAHRPVRRLLATFQMVLGSTWKYPALEMLKGIKPRTEYANLIRCFALDDLQISLRTIGSSASPEGIKLGTLGCFSAICPIRQIFSERSRHIPTFADITPLSPRFHPSTSLFFPTNSTVLLSCCPCIQWQASKYLLRSTSQLWPLGPFAALLLLFFLGYHLRVHCALSCVSLPSCSGHYPENVLRIPMIIVL